MKLLRRLSDALQICAYVVAMYLLILFFGSIADQVDKHE